MRSKSDWKPMKIGFIGGSIESAVGYAHFCATRMDGLFDVVAGCFSRDHKINHDTAQSYGVSQERVYDNWRHLIAHEYNKLDAVVILTPTPDHDEIIIEALQNGYNVICEKALTDTLSKALRIQSELAQSSGFLAVTYNYSGYPMVRELRYLIESGQLGKIQNIQVEMPQEGFLRKDHNGVPSKPQSWRLRDGEIATLHLDLGVHVHQLVHYLTQLKPLEVVATASNLGCFGGIIDDLNALVKYEEGVVANFWYSKIALGQRNGLKVRVFGDKGSAEWLQIDPENLLVSHSDGRREIRDRAVSANVSNASRYMRFKPGHPAGYIEAFANLYSDIYQIHQAHQQERNETISQEVFGIDLALEGIYFLEAVSKSVRNGTWEKVGQTLSEAGE